MKWRKKVARCWKAPAYRRDEITYQRTADMRYVGQGHEVSVALPDGVLSADTLAAQSRLPSTRLTVRLYGRKGPDVPLEVINWRVVASGPRPEMNFKLPRDSASGSDMRKGSRRAYFPERGGLRGYRGL